MEKLFLTGHCKRKSKWESLEHDNQGGGSGTCLFGDSKREPDRAEKRDLSNKEGVVLIGGA